MLAPWATALGYWPAFLNGLWLTATMSVLAFVFAFVLGVSGPSPSLRFRAIRSSERSTSR